MSLFNFLVNEELMIEDIMFLLPSNLDIYLLGILFKVPSSMLDKIDVKDMEKSRLEFFKHLLSTNPQLTWTAFADILIKMKRADLVLTLKNKYGITVDNISTQGILILLLLVSHYYTLVSIFH